MLMPLFPRFPRLWFDSQLKSSLFPDKLLGSTDLFFAPSSLLIKHLHIVPLITRILLAPCSSSLFWITFFMLFCTMEGHHSTHKWALPMPPAEVTEEHKLHSCSHLQCRSHTPQPRWFLAAYTNPAIDGLMGFGTQSPALTPSCWSPLCTVEPIATVAQSKRANPARAGDNKVAHSQLHSSTCRWHGYTLLSQAALHLCSLA